jgi:hypothetical protein
VPGGPILKEDRTRIFHVEDDGYRRGGYAGRLVAEGCEARGEVKCSAVRNRVVGRVKALK